MMGIAYVCREFGPVTGGGIGTYVYNACMAMVARGHRVYLVTDCFNEENLHLLPEHIELVVLHETRTNRQGSFVSPHHEYSYRVYDTLHALVDDGKIDVVEFAEFGVEGFTAIRAKRILGEFDETKLVVKLHTPGSLLYEINEDRRLHVDSLCDYYMEDYCVKYADMVTSPSSSLGEYFKKRVERNDIRRCPYPMQLPEREKARTFTEKEIKTVRLIGSIQVRKGIDTFIYAAIQVLEVDPDFRFEIWGADRGAQLLDQSYTQICARLIPERYRDHIVFAGSVSYAEIPSLYRSCCFCVYPSRWENWANVCLEAMSYGCVVLASKNGGMAEMIEHGRSGFVIDPLDPAEVASIILEHYQQVSLLEEISTRAQARSRKICDPARAAEQIESNYRQPGSGRIWKKLPADPPLVSIIIPFYNQHRYLEETIASVRESTYPNVEIVVVNDGSTDPAAVALFDSLEGVTKVSQQNGGLSAARNTGIAAAAGELILPLDADDLIEDDYISRGAAALLNNHELGYVSCHAQNFGLLDNAYIPVGYVPELMPFTNTHGKCSNLYRKELFFRCGGYDEIMTSYEDWDFLLTLDECGIEGDVLPAELFRYRRHLDSMVYTVANRMRTDLIQYMMIKHEKALAPYAAKMAIMLARLWKESEIRHEFAEQQIANAYFHPATSDWHRVAGATRVQIYSAAAGQWWEHNSVYVDIPEDQWNYLTINLPFANHEGVFRIDPANGPGLILVRRISLREAGSDRLLFSAGGRGDFSSCQTAGRVHSRTEGGYLVIEADDEDPQILLPPLSKPVHARLELELLFTTDTDQPIDKIARKYRPKTDKSKLKRLLSQFLSIFNK